MATRAERVKCERACHQLGDRHPDTASTMNNLASLLQDERSLDEAEPLYRESLHLRERLLGPTSLSLETRQRLLAPDHPDIATSLMAVGDRARKRHDHPAAETAFAKAERALTRCGEKTS
jgi:hypothetical protein